MRAGKQSLVQSVPGELTMDHTTALDVSVVFTVQLTWVTWVGFRARVLPGQECLASPPPNVDITTILIVKWWRQDSFRNC